MPPGWSRGAGSGPRPSAAFAFTPRRRSRPHRIPVEPDLERKGQRAETCGFLGRFANVLPHEGAHVRGRPDLPCITVRSRMVGEVLDDRPVRVARRPATPFSTAVNTMLGPRHVANPASVSDVLDANRGTSTPSSWSICTQRLHSGGGFFGSWARWLPCLKRPPATRIGRFVAS